MHTKIMIVDDSLFARALLQATLSHVSPDAVVFEASGADEAFGLIAREEFDAAIVDFHMPDMDGLTLAKKLKEAKPDLPITLLTANVQREIREQADNLGIGFLNKPISEEDAKAVLMGIA